MRVKISKVRKDSIIPQRATPKAIGFDVFASIVLDKKTRKPIGKLPVEIKAGESILIGIGVRMAIPFPWQCEARPRSGLATKYDIELFNSPGTIDPDFRGEIALLLRNNGKKNFIVEKNMRIAQLIFSKVEIPAFQKVNKLSATTRGEKGFGSTGLFKIKR